MAWTAPQSVQALQRERPGSGEESEEAATQRACNMQQVIFNTISAAAPAFFFVPDAGQFLAAEQRPPYILSEPCLCDILANES